MVVSLRAFSGEVDTFGGAWVDFYLFWRLRIFWLVAFVSFAA